MRSLRRAFRRFAAFHLVALLILGIAPASRAQVVSEEEMRAGFQALSLLLAGPLSTQEEAAIRVEIAGRSRTEPQVIKQEMQELAALVKALAGLDSGEAVAAFRQALLAAVFQNATDNPLELRRAAIKLLYSRLGPVAWNAEDGTFFSLADAQVLVWLAGGPPGDEAVVADTALRIQAVYGTLPYDQRLLLGTLHLAHAMGLLQGVAPTPPQGASGTTPAPAGGAEPWAYEIMSDVMTDMHITTLNIIENMGDSGDYWEWQPAW